MPLQAILFDIDGTLVDSNNLHIDAWDEVFRAAGHVIDRQRLHDQVGKGGDNYVPALLPQLGHEEQERIAHAHGEVYKKKYIARAKPFPGARELLLRTRSAGLKVVLASSASQPELDHYLDLLDARAIVDATTSADDVAHSKPCPDIFEMARQKAGVPAADAVVIGDTPYDILAATRSGIRAVGVRSGGFQDRALSDAIAIYDDVGAVLADFDHLLLTEPA
jgi:HAD superfamily hydrolase (TIGR01509 family)